MYAFTYWFKSEKCEKKIEKMHLFPAGTMVEVEIIGCTEDKNNRVQAVSVRFKDSDFASKWCAVNQPHVKKLSPITTMIWFVNEVTISCNENVQPKEVILLCLISLAFAQNRKYFFKTRLWLQRFFFFTAPLRHTHSIGKNSL